MPTTQSLIFGVYTSHITHQYVTDHTSCITQHTSHHASLMPPSSHITHHASLHVTLITAPSPHHKSHITPPHITHIMHRSSAHPQRRMAVHSVHSGLHGSSSSIRTSCIVEATREVGAHVGPILQVRRPTPSPVGHVGAAPAGRHRLLGFIEPEGACTHICRAQGSRV